MTEETKKDNDVPMWRELLGAVIAFVIVVSFISIGFIDFIAHGVFEINENVEFNAGWLSAMLSLASTAFGYLVGKNMPGRMGRTRGGVCPTCGK